MKLLPIMRTRLSMLLGLSAILLLMPTVLMAQERIAFSTAVDNNSDVWSMMTNGTDRKRLTANSASDGDPSFSPDGSKIAFVSFRDGNPEIYVMNADGTDQKRLTNNAATDNDPAWSPDGSKILFVSFRDGTGAEVYTMDADGMNPVNLTNFPGNDTEPAFSPDGKKIVFRGLRDGTINVFVMKPDGSDQTPLTSDQAFNMEPSFSPDGTKIVFRSNRDGNFDVYIMDADGKNQTNLTNNPSGSVFAPSFSPDGTKIIYIDGVLDISAMDADGSNRVNLTNSALSESDPSWGASNSVPALTDVTVADSINEGDTVTLAGEIVDENAGDKITFTVDWGDGNLQGLEYSPGPFALTHTYADDAPAGSQDQYSITYSVNDHRFGVDVDSKPVTVNNINPTVSDLAVASSTVPLGSQITLSANYSDPGYHGSPSDEQLGVIVIWGDGQTKTLTTTGAPGAILETHQYAAMGTYTIGVQVTDNDGGFTLETIDVVVSPPAPPAAPAGLRVDSISMNRIQIVWTDNSDNEDGFIVEGCAQRGCNNFIEIGRVFPNIRHFVHGNLFPNTQYYYRIRAFNAGGTSAYTGVVSAKTLRK
jgi:Tol biopolymer transport system component